MDGYLIALDQGTTSSRAILFDRNGNTVAKAQYSFSQIYPQPGWVEHDASEILATQLHALAETMVQSGISPSDIAGIGITNQRETTVLWDKHTGKPVCNAIVWQCRRTADLCAQLEKDGMRDYIYTHTGLLIDPYFSGTKIRWLLDRDPSLRKRAENGEILFGTIDSWLIWNLTGGKAHVTDYSNAARTMLFDIDRLCWDDAICKALRIPTLMLPRPVGNAEQYGTVAKLPGLEALEGIPICGSAGDQQAALFGQACFAAGMAKNTYGTGCFTLMNIGSQSVRSTHSLLTTIGWNIGGNTTYVLEGSAFNAGSAIKWLRDECGMITTAHECDVEAEKLTDNQGVFFVPAFTGLGAPYWDSAARGCFFGLTRGSGKSAMCRAVLESIAYEVTDLVRTMDLDTGVPLTELRVDGGASVSDFMMRFQSDLLNCAVNRPANVETTALGAAYLAGLASGVWTNLSELDALRKADRIFRPEMQDSQRETLLRHWQKAVALSREWGNAALG